MLNVCDTFLELLSMQRAESSASKEKFDGEGIVPSIIVILIAVTSRVKYPGLAILRRICRSYHPAASNINVSNITGQAAGGMEDLFPDIIKF